MLPPALLTLAFAFGKTSPWLCSRFISNSFSWRSSSGERPAVARRKSESISEIHTQPRSYFSSKRAKVLSECLLLSSLVQRNKSHNPPTRVTRPSQSLQLSSPANTSLLEDEHKTRSNTLTHAPTPPALPVLLPSQASYYKKPSVSNLFLEKQHEHDTYKSHKNDTVSP